jgi:arabinogalactan endo-1,4-beta-galactosidase
MFSLFLLLAACKKEGSNSQRGSGNNPPNPVPASFARGADISWLTQMESSGYLFYYSTGKQTDCMQILKSLGLNSIRLRAWVNPANGWCNTVDLATKAVRAKNLGFRIMVDFHYSDVWADPGHQTKPASWALLPFASLPDTLYQYTYRVLDTLKSLGIQPEWVQVGNETNDGMLWEDGRASTKFGNYVQLINAGYSAAKAVDDSAKVIVHISNGFDNGLFRWMFDSLQFYGAHWDVIGMSLYPSTSNWSALDQQCLSNMNDMVTRYGKSIMISEIGMDVNAPAISRSFISDMVHKTSSLPGGKGLGVFYWEPECYNWQQYSLGAFGNNGQPTAALYGFTD